MFAAVDVGGTKTLVAVFAKYGKVVEQVKFPTPENYDDFKIELAKNVAGLSTTEFQKCVVAIPGLVDRRRGIGIAFGNLKWQNVPVGIDAETIFNCPVAVENDANLAGLSEAYELRKDYCKVLYITVSTGIGSGFIVNGKIDPDTEDAELGHILLGYKGELRRWQDFASGKAIVSQFGKRASDIPANDTKTWGIIARNIAIGLVAAIATYTPDAVVIGGGVGTHLSKFKKLLDKELDAYKNPMVSSPPILPARRAEEAVIYGGYLYAKQSTGATIVSY